MIFQDGDTKWVVSLDDIKVAGYSPVKVNSLYYFFRLKGRTSIITLDNIEPITPAKYLLHSKAEGRYYIKDYRGYQFKELFDLVYSGSDPFINNFVNWIADGNIYLLYTTESVADMNSMLERIHNTKLSFKGKLPYPLFLEIFELQMKYEDYKDFGRELTGYKTVSNQFELALAELWKKAVK